MTAWQSDNTEHPGIRMMGQATGQRSTMSMSHGSYYVDTTVPAATQGYSNVFQAGQTYWFYVLYAKPSLHQTYSMYIGKNLSENDAVALVQTGLMEPTHNVFTPGLGPDATSDWITAKNYDPSTGVLSIIIDLGEQSNVLTKDKVNFCQPTSYCSYINDSCQCNPNNSECKDNSVCSWGTKEIDCPVAGCFAFSVKMPDGFQTGGAPIPPPDPVLFSKGADSSYFASVAFTNVPSSISGEACYYPTPPPGQPSRAARSQYNFLNVEPMKWSK
jgi:hypothetical protein